MASIPIDLLWFESLGLIMDENNNKKKMKKKKSRSRKHEEAKRKWGHPHFPCYLP